MSRRQKATPEEKIYLIKRYIKGEISQAQWSVMENNKGNGWLMWINDLIRF